MIPTPALLASAILATATLLTAAAGTAQASTAVPAPSCEPAYAAHLECYIVSPPPAGTVVDWTLQGNGVTRMFTAGSNTGIKGCRPDYYYTATYSYTIGGVEFASLPGGTDCLDISV
jgi:hypothetical protein